MASANVSRGSGSGSRARVLDKIRKTHPRRGLSVAAFGAASTTNASRCLGAAKRATSLTTAFAQTTQSKRSRSIPRTLSVPVDFPDRDRLTRG